ncbi:acyl-CoA dehydrogenase [Verticiella sediminum]|uniref:Acyl-CoA dehydrogenase n=1 Tax=Verticiella sediminum TaxID=1247510 RepID=A0A556B0F4_9BURK|nr:acyl-CoA dehydrogenase family protein [Verticiella sediminum]TSH98614.1 acyl-CoA dehydrogenase [Verticiella sediminum]
MSTAQAVVIQPAPPDVDCDDLRLQVRAFLREALAGMPAELRAKSWGGSDPAFSLALGERGWLGMTWSKRLGGGERSALERYVVLEELLAAGAPVGAHWVAERQSGPLLMRYARPEVAEAIVPRIARGELRFCIGMSEPDAGSDLASVRTRAVPEPGGWRVNGTKLWTSGAHQAHYMIALVRTDHEADKHAGLSQLLIDMTSPGVEARPIRNLEGGAHFNEVVLRDVFVPDAMLIGAPGDGWRQVTAELALERSGPERYLSSYRLLVAMLDAADVADPRHATELGYAVAEMSVLRQMSRGVAWMLQQGQSPQYAAASVKDMGTSFEQSLPDRAHRLFAPVPGMDDTALGRVHTYMTQVAPSFSLRGGTREILRGMIAKGMGLR